MSRQEALRRLGGSTMDPFEALQRAIHVTHGCLRGHGPHCQPGEALSFCSSGVRRALRRLRSEDVEDVRIEGLV